MNNVLIANGYAVLLKKMFNVSPDINYIKDNRAVVYYNKAKLPIVQKKFKEMVYSGSDSKEGVTVDWLPIIEPELYKAGTIVSVFLILTGYVIGKLGKK